MSDHQQRATALANAQANRLRDLKERAADRPAHLTFLNRLLAVSNDHAMDDVPRPPKVSQRVADALIQDVSWCREELPEVGQLYAYPGAYETLRLASARAAGQRDRGKFQRDLGHLLAL